MHIKITTNSLRKVASKRRFVASICLAINEFLTKGETLVIEIDGKVRLTDVGEALRHISELVDGAASITKDAEDESDPADWWKEDDEV